MRRRRAGVAITFMLVTASTGSAQRYELRNGRWFDGRTFVERILFVDRGVFVASRPEHIDSVVDLALPVR